MKNSSKLYLIRHAESSPDPNIPESDWPLSERGRIQAEDLIRVFRDIPVNVIASSPYPRAVETIAPLSEKKSKEIFIENDLRERKLCEGSRKDWKELLIQSWEDFTFSLPNCESGHDCQKRIKNCINRLVARFPNQTILASSHGNAIALFLNSIDRSFGFEGWKDIKNPDVYKITFKGNSPSKFERINIVRTKSVVVTAFRSASSSTTPPRWVNKQSSNDANKTPQNSG